MINEVVYYSRPKVTLNTAIPNISLLPTQVHYILHKH